MPGKLLTIGQLAKRANVATSLLRYYEQERLLMPSGRSEAGYRLYSPDAERTLRFIRSAQRYGFSLSDIKLIVGVGDATPGDDVDVRDVAEQRFLAIERRVTEMLVLRHELELLLDDMTAHVDRSAGRAVGRHYRDLVEQVCGHDPHGPPKSSLRKLVQRLNCNLASAEWEEVFAELRGRHLHIWRDDDGYSILFVNAEHEVRHALKRLAASESDCEAHLQPEVSSDASGLIFRARGENAFLFAQLFLALEAANA
jgi:MerR family Zn(II)-responsive transcriptional regulator of zntA